MAISERQLETWSHQGSTAQSAATYQSIRSVLEDRRAPFAKRTYEVFLQGSYGNDTNVYIESDVDIVICLSSVFYYDTSELSESDKVAFEADRSPADYTFSEFRGEVARWLVQAFGEGVKVGKKAIFVPGNSARRDADVLVCVEHHRYTTYKSKWDQRYHKGICFWTASGEKIVNYPKQHAENCTTKHQLTRNRFKANVRVIKNMRIAMVHAQYLQDETAPSYFLEGMLWNIPGTEFVTSYQETMQNVLRWLNQCDSSQPSCANDLHWLVRDGASVCWNNQDYQAFLSSARQFFDKGN